jgi:hypothetical protein
VRGQIYRSKGLSAKARVFTVALGYEFGSRLLLDGWQVCAFTH